MAYETPAMANCCVQALVHIGIKANNRWLPQWVCAGWMDVWIQVGTKRAVRIASAFDSGSVRRFCQSVAICSSLEQSLVGMQMINDKVFVCLEC
jgi:hypothetical protein